MGRLDNQQSTTTTYGRLPKAVVTGQQEVQPVSKGNFITNAPENIGMLFRGDIKVGDVAKRMPGVAYRGALKTAQTVAPGISNFIDTTGSIFGEGLAYAIDPNVRKQYKAGNTDILPTITKTTGKDLFKDTFAAGLETAIIRGIPGAMKGALPKRAALGGLEGLGFAISEGIAKDQTPEEIMDNATLYGASGAAISVVAPWLGPLLKKEIGRATPEIKAALKNNLPTEEAAKVLKTSGEATEAPVAAKTGEVVGTGAQAPKTPENPLFEEALKYKSAEEFIKAQGTPVYHGTRADVIKEFDLSKARESGYSKIGVWTSDNIESASTYGTRVETVIPPKNANLLQFDSWEQFENFVATKHNARKDLELGQDHIAVRDFLKEEGYDGIEILSVEIDDAPMQTVQVFIDPKSLKTRTQLEDIWKQANNTAPKTLTESTASVPSNQLPIGGQTKGLSRLEARMLANSDDPATQAAVRNYAKYSDVADAPQATGASNRVQAQRAAQFIETLNDEKVVYYLNNLEELPPEILKTSFIKGASERASLKGSQGLMARIAGQITRRFGEEIQYLRTYDPLDPATNLADILAIRVKAAERKLPKGTKVSTVKREVAEEMTKSELKIQQAEELLDSIVC